MGRTQRDTEPHGLRAPALARRFGISYRQLDWWIRTGTITELDNPDSGSGSRREIPNETANRLAYAAALVKDGLTPRAAWAKAGELSTTGRTTIAGMTLHAHDE